MRKKFVELCKKELQNNKNFHVLLGDISVGAFLDKNDNLTERVLNMGIAEQAMIGFASGLSSMNNTVVVHTIAAFLVERAFEQIKLCCGYNETKLILISANGPYDYDKLGPTHHCASDITLLSTIPNLTLYAPSTDEEFAECFYKALQDTKSSYIRCTSRSIEALDSTEVKDFKRVYNTKGSLSKEETFYKSNAIVCVGEALKFYLTTKAKNENSTVYYTSNVNAVIPNELLHYYNIKIYEPYTQNFIKVPEHFNNTQVQKYCFKVEHKKIIKQNMGWEDFE